VTYGLPADHDVIAEYREQLDRVGYLVVTDVELGVPFGTHLANKFFTKERLRRYDGDMPVDRLRARDVVQYDRFGDDLDLTEHDTVDLLDRGNPTQIRHFDQTEVLKDEKFATLIKALLNLVPEGRRKSAGTFGINMFRTFTDIVTRPHHDEEEYVIVYVVAKTAKGGRTQLLHNNRDEVVLERELQPGQLIMFRDDMFRHSATTLETPAEKGTHRDALICTVDYPTTYGIGLD
jgi:hypothetical protein